jgi:hypothetical protein
LAVAGFVAGAPPRSIPFPAAGDLLAVAPLAAG